MTRDGCKVVTASKDWTARVWDAQTGRSLFTLSSHSDSVIGAIVQENLDLVVTYSLDDTVKIWSMENGGLIGTIELPDTIQRVAISTEKHIAVALRSGNMHFFSIDCLDRSFEIRTHNDDITGLQFSSDGFHVASSSLDCTVNVIDVRTADITGLFISDYGITTIYFDGVTNYIVAGTERGVVHFIDANCSIVPSE